MIKEETCNAETSTDLLDEFISDRVGFVGHVVVGVYLADAHRE